MMQALIIIDREAVITNLIFFSTKYIYELEEDQTHFHYIPPITFIIITTDSTCEIAYGETPQTTINSKKKLVQMELLLSQNS